MRIPLPLLLASGRLLSCLSLRHAAKSIMVVVISAFGMRGHLAHDAQLSCAEGHCSQSSRAVPAWPTVVAILIPRDACCPLNLALLGFALRLDRCHWCSCNSMPDGKIGVWFAFPAPSCVWLDDNVQRLSDRNILMQSRLQYPCKGFSNELGAVYVTARGPMTFQTPWQRAMVFLELSLKQVSVDDSQAACNWSTPNPSQRCCAFRGALIGQRLMSLFNALRCHAGRRLYLRAMPSL